MCVCVCTLRRMITSCIILEGGGYLTTVREKEIADKKLEECKFLYRKRNISITCMYMHYI